MKRKGPRAQSLARRILQYLHDDGGLYSIPVLADEFREDTATVRYAVCGMVHLGRVQVDRRQPYGSLYEISAEGREWLAEQKEKA